MENSRLLYLLKALSAQEMRQLSKWVQSPFFNESADLTLLFDYLHKKHPHFSDSNSLALPYIFSTLFGNKQPYREIKMRQLMSKLLTATEEFLAYQHWQRNDVAVKIHVANALHDRQLPKHYNAIYKETIAQNEAQTLRNANYYEAQEQIALLNHRHIETQEKREIEPQLQAVSDSLDKLFVLNKLKFFCKMFNYQRLSNTPLQYQYTFIEPILTFAAALPADKSPVMAAYFHALNTIKDSENETHFTQLKNMITHHADLFLPDELQDLFVLARNFCIRRTNMGNRYYANELLDLYKAEIKSGSILVNKYVAPATYKNIISIALALKQDEWAAEFSEQFKPHLRPEHREEVYALNLARVMFNQQKYAPILPLLQQVHYRDTMFELAAKTLLLQTYFELQEINVLESFLDSFSVFLQRKTSASYRKHHQNLIKFVKKLLSLPKYDKAAHQALWQEANQLPNITERQWLLDKITKRE